MGCNEKILLSGLVSTEVTSFDLNAAVSKAWLHKMYLFILLKNSYIIFLLFYCHSNPLSPFIQVGNFGNPQYSKNMLIASCFVFVQSKIMNFIFDKQVQVQT